MPPFNTRSRAPAAYWAGRPADALGKTKASENWYAKASHYTATYYGQLAAATTSRSLVVPRAPLISEHRPSKAETTAFDRNELVRAALILGTLGQDNLLRPFLDSIARLAKTKGEFVLAARLAIDIERLDLAVFVARRGYRQGNPLFTFGYPVINVPDGRPEKALLLEVTRQESNFRIRARSWAGARGLMQLMPATARMVSRSLRIRFTRHRLETDPRYSITLGRAHLAELLKRFDESYVLTLAAYNAGPAPVRRCIRAAGDPRYPSIDVIDWIEIIPYNETRNYVQRVLENLQIYRRRLGETVLAFSLERDLKR